MLIDGAVRSIESATCRSAPWISATPGRVAHFRNRDPICGKSFTRAPGSVPHPALQPASGQSSARGRDKPGCRHQLFNGVTAGPCYSPKHQENDAGQPRTTVPEHAAPTLISTRFGLWSVEAPRSEDFSVEDETARCCATGRCRYSTRTVRTDRIMYRADRSPTSRMPPREGEAARRKGGVSPIRSRAEDERSEGLHKRSAEDCWETLAPRQGSALRGLLSLCVRGTQELSGSRCGRNRPQRWVAEAPQRLETTEEKLLPENEAFAICLSMSIRGKM
jgi:hypothetical protein